ncbi:MAG: hemin-degrading factor [Rhizobiaceae bacterium]
MTPPVQLRPQQIRQARADNPKMRERDLAKQLGICELQLLAAHCGDGAIRLEPRVGEIVKGLEAVGEVMALTRNESAVHEKIGVYDKIVGGDHSILALGEQIDLRIFPRVWTHAFAVEKRDGDDLRRSLQFFDARGDAVHKVHLRPASDLAEYQKLVDAHVSTDQSQTVVVTAPAQENTEPASANQEELRHRWSKMTDVHQFFGILKSLNLSRQQALQMVGHDYAWELDAHSVGAMMNSAAASSMPIMCFVGNRGCIQIHSGPIATIKPMGPWLNVMDETFHLHLRLDHIREVWAVRKPNKDGHVTSLEAYDADGEMIIQFFGKRLEGYEERPDWRVLIENQPRVASLSAA